MVLKAENIAKSFGRNRVLKNVSLEMHPPGLYGIVGENGSGKTTLLKIIVGEWRPDHGKITVEGRLGYCPQDTLLFRHLTVDENLRYFAAAYGIDGDTLASRSEYLMDHFNFASYRKEKTEKLSGGTLQKLNLVIALLHRPELLILDEPYSGFDWDTYLRFCELTDKLREEGCAILVVTHLLTEKERFDRIYNLSSGQLT